MIRPLAEMIPLYMGWVNQAPPPKPKPKPGGSKRKVKA